MRISSLRLLLVATTIILFGQVLINHVSGQVIDRDTQRHGMHVCPAGQFVSGVNLRENLLKCSTAFGTYLLSDEVVDRSTRAGETLACPEGMAMTGYHWRNNVVACAPINRSIPRFLDAGTLMSSGGVTMHSCPASPAAGINESRSLLLCGTTGRADGGRTGEFIDTGTQRNGMHSCARGFIVGVHVRQNLLLCSSEFGDYSAADERVERNPGSIHMPTCPQGMAMTGLRVNGHEITCARVTGPPSQRVTDSRTQRFGMHACPPGKPVARLDLYSNELVCGTRGEPLRGMTITSVEPASPRVGDLVVIKGYQLGGSEGAAPRNRQLLSSATRNGVSGVALDEVTARSRRPGFGEGTVTGPGRRFWLPVIQHTPDRILVVMDRVSPGEYSVAIRDRDPNDFVRATESNGVSVTVRQPDPRTSPNGPRTSMDATTVRLVHPGLTMAGQVLDVYGDFPAPDVNSFEVLLRPVGPDAIVFPNPNQQFEMVHPTAVMRNHLTVRLPSLLAGEWSLSVRRRGGGPEGASAHFFVRDRPPEEWENLSELIRGAGAVPFRLVAAEANVGPNGWSVDILGYGFGANQADRPLHVLTRELLEGIKSNLSAGPDGALNPVPAYLEASFWSETRIRVEVPHRPGQAPTPGVRYVVIRERNRERWSNAVAVQIQ